MKKKQLIDNILTYSILTFGAIIMLFPFYWMILGAFKTPAEYTSFPPKFFVNNLLNFQNFIDVFNKVPFMTFFKNSIYVTFMETLLCTITTILGAFIYSRLRWKGRKLAFMVLTVFMMIPGEMMMITNFKTIVNMHLVNNVNALWIPFTTNIMYTITLKNFFDTIPDTLYYSAKIDGASNWQYLWKVMVPVARPSLFSIILLCAINTFNSYVWTSLVIYNNAARTIPTAIQLVVTEFSQNETLQMAVATIAVLPTTIIFLLCRKSIVTGVARGGMKG